MLIKKGIAFKNYVYYIFKNAQSNNVVELNTNKLLFMQRKGEEELFI